MARSLRKILEHFRNPDEVDFQVARFMPLETRGQSREDRVLRADKVAREKQLRADRRNARQLWA